MSISTPTVELTYKNNPIDVKLDVYSPEGDASVKRQPLLMYFHAGALMYGSKRSLVPQWMVDGCRSRGWTFISSNYSLMPESTIDDTLQDVKDLWSFIHNGRLNDALNLLDRPMVDTSHCFVTGSSAGGYLTLQMGHLCSPPPKALVPMYGYGFSKASWFATRQPSPADLVICGIPSSGFAGREHELEAFYEKGKRRTSAREMSPMSDPVISDYIFHYSIGRGTYFKDIFGVSEVSDDPSVSYLWPQTSITSDYPPTYLLHGSADSAVPSSESEVIAQVLQKNGVEHVLNIIEGMEHFLDQVDDNKEVSEAREAIWKFLEKRL